MSILKHGLCGAVLLALAGSAQAHDVPPSTAIIDVRSSDMGIELHMPLGELASALQWQRPATAEAALRDRDAELRQYIEAHVAVRGADGEPWQLGLDRLYAEHSNNPALSDNDWIVADLHASPRADAAMEQLTYEDSLITHRVVSHQTMVYLRRDLRHGMLGEPLRLAGVLGFGNSTLTLQRGKGSLWLGARALFMSGMRHIAEGSDHLCFLLALMLPAPLLLRSRRWGGPTGPRRASLNLLRVVSGFTLGHSLTLALVGFGLMMPPERWVETAIALTVLASAVHAIRPIFAGRELPVAALFGLVHGLAFGTAIALHNDDAYGVLLSVLCFNLGIEAGQLALVALAFPWLLLWASSPSYRGLRVALALAMGLTAIGWALQRAFGLADPLEDAVEWARVHGAYGLGLLALGAVIARQAAGSPGSRVARVSQAPLHSTMT